jgi:DNA-binding MarR family transcriptional regulator
MIVVDAARLEKRREKTAKARATGDRRPYFYGVAEARYLLRKVFRLIEEEAKRAGIDPLAHQALIQIYGSETECLRVKDIAERLDITPAFASSLIKLLEKKGWVARSTDKNDSRVAWIKVTASGRSLLYHIDEQVQIHVDYFVRDLTSPQTEAALSALMFYIGATLKHGKRKYS